MPLTAHQPVPHFRPTRHHTSPECCKSVILRLMNEPKASSPRRSRWTWRRIAAGSAIGLGIVWLAAYLYCRDPGRAKAIAIYEAMQPGMHNSKLFELLDREGLTWTGVK